MNCRKFLTLSAAVGLFPAAAHSQSPRRTIGVLMAGSEGSPENVPRIAAFRKALTRFGSHDGDNVEVTYRWSAGRTAASAICEGAGRARARRDPRQQHDRDFRAQEQDRNHPRRFALAMDPVGLGQIKSLSHPGGNFTGFTFIDPELIGKWMELLGDVAPGLTQAGLLFNPDTMNPYPNFVREVQGRRSEEDQPQTGSGEDDEDMTSAMQSFAASPGSGLMIGPDPFNQVHLKQIAEFAARQRLPTISVYRSYVTAGGLMGYGPTSPTCFAGRPPMSTGSSRARNPPTSRCSSPTSSSSSSISRPRRRSGLPSRRPCWRRPTRPSSDALIFLGRPARDKTALSKPWGPSMTKIRVGLVGCGFVSELHMYAYRRVYGVDVEVTAVAARGDHVAEFAAQARHPDDLSQLRRADRRPRDRRRRHLHAAQSARRR